MVPVLRSQLETLARVGCFARLRARCWLSVELDGEGPWSVEFNVMAAGWGMMTASPASTRMGRSGWSSNTNPTAPVFTMSRPQALSAIR